ncbi:hypothetical protein [Aeromicrobium sp. NPDC092404]|uniref:hypothetical protein n=1 Tax=Aeromicrobium sp. NPDC092404 TaxID=3154976 RepID=UPI003421B463
MSTVRRRRIAATALATTALLTLGACGTSFDAQTNQVYQAAVGADHRGDIDALSTLLVANEDGSASLSTSLINNTDEGHELTSVEATTMDGKPLEVRSGEPLEVPRDVVTPVGAATSPDGFWITEGAAAGDYVRLTLTFTDSAPITIEAPVVTRTAEYAGVGAQPAAEPTDTEQAEQAETESTEDAPE